MNNEEKHKAINDKITECWNKLVQDSKQVSGYNYDQYGSDLLAYCLEEFLIKKDVDYQYQVAIIDNKLPNYIGRAMSLQIRSKTSPFWHKYRKSMYNTRGVYEAEDATNESLYEDMDYNLSPDKEKSAYDCMMWVMNTQLDFYERTIVDKIYIQGWTKKRMMDYYQLPNNSFNRDINKTLNKFRKLCSTFI